MIRKIKPQPDFSQIVANDENLFSFKFYSKSL